MSDLPTMNIINENLTDTVMVNAEEIRIKVEPDLLNVEETRIKVEPDLPFSIENSIKVEPFEDWDPVHNDVNDMNDSFDRSQVTNRIRSDDSHDIKNNIKSTKEKQVKSKRQKLFNCSLCPTRAATGLYKMPEGEKRAYAKEKWIEFCTQFIPKDNLNVPSFKLCFKHFKQTDFVPSTPTPGKPKPRLVLWPNSFPSIYEEYDEQIKKVKNQIIIIKKY